MSHPDRRSVHRMGNRQLPGGGQDPGQNAWPGTDMKNNEDGGANVPRQISKKGLKSFQATRRSSHNNDIVTAHKASKQP